MSQLRLAILTNRGQRRPENQDAILSLRFGDRVLLAVADGLGGLANGAVASRHTLQRVRKTILEDNPPDPMARIMDALETANAEFVRIADGEPQKAMGTTAVGLLFSERGAATFNIGDSRAYRLRDGAIAQLTQDHSVAAEKVKDGSLTAGELASDPRRNQLTRCIGVEPAFDLDVTEPEPVEPGDRYLVCSDGLYAPLPDADLATIVVAARDPLQAAARLIDAANKAGGPDNISAGLAFFD